MSIQSDKQAKDFIEKETQFHLGFLPTEQSSPLTKNLDREFAKSAVDGVKNLQSVDRNVLTMFRRVFASDRFQKLVDDGFATIQNGGRIVFSGCGATGRLSILLESMWRRSCAKNPAAAKYADNVFSIMTGGDFALVKSVESFEDFQIFGRRQVQDLGLNSKDMLVAITEGGETSSVLGTVFESVERGLKVFLMFNNPADLLSEHLERSRKAITDPRVCVLDLSCGPMSLAGSTRMQATTSEQLTAGGALEQIMDRLLGNPVRDYAAEFEALLNQLETGAVRKTIGAYIEFEAGIYKKHGLITYFSGEYQLDIFTDTTERSPTFMLPPFRKKDDSVSPRPRTFVKDPELTTKDVWQKAMNRSLRCIVRFAAVMIRWLSGRTMRLLRKTKSVKGSRLRTVKVKPRQRRQYSTFSKDIKSQPSKSFPNRKRNIARFQRASNHNPINKNDSSKLDTRFPEVDFWERHDILFVLNQQNEIELCFPS